MELSNLDNIVNQSLSSNSSVSSSIYPYFHFELQEEKEEFKDMEKQKKYEDQEIFVSINSYENIYEAFETSDIFDKIMIIKNIVNENQAQMLKNIVKEFFENDFLKKISNLSRPLEKKYNDVIERKLGRFEIIPPDNILFSIWNILRINPLFVSINQKIKMEIENLSSEFNQTNQLPASMYSKKNNPCSKYCIEELGILPIEPHTEDGYWHRDVVTSERDNVFESKPYYITQIIYLDNLANTEFCVKSNKNRNNNFIKYDKKIICSDLCSSVVFDGRHLHRGLANRSNETRYAIYISYYDSYYKRREYDINFKLY